MKSTKAPTKAAFAAGSEEMSGATGLYELRLAARAILIARLRHPASGVGKSRTVVPSEVVASLVVVVPRVTRQGFGRFVRVFGMNCPRVRGGAGLASAFGLIRSLSALGA
jgi:hypothetical protein